MLGASRRAERARRRQRLEVDDVVRVRAQDRLLVLDDAAVRRLNLVHLGDDLALLLEEAERLVRRAEELGVDERRAVVSLDADRERKRVAVLEERRGRVGRRRARALGRLRHVLRVAELCTGNA